MPYYYYQLPKTTKLKFDIEYDPANENGIMRGGTVTQILTEINDDGTERQNYSAYDEEWATVVNNKQYSLYKKTDTTLIEKNEDIHYQIIFTNNTTNNLPDFQLLDVLPQNGDQRGSMFNGSYSLDKIAITRYR